MIKKKCFLLFLAISFTGIAFADEKSKGEKIKELMGLQGINEMVEQASLSAREKAKSHGTQMIEMIKKSKPDLSQEVLEKLQAAFSSFLASTYSPEYSNQLVDAWQKFYGEQVTEEELNQILAFYKSPFGQKDVMATKKATPKWLGFSAEFGKIVFTVGSDNLAQELKNIVGEKK